MQEQVRGVGPYEPSASIPVSYYHPEEQSEKHQSSPQPTGLTFDLIAVGSEDEDIEGPQHLKTVCTDANAEGDLNEIDDVDRRSIYVGNVDYGATPPELQEHFKNCGAINRITIMVDSYTGHPKGYAYIEFQDEAAIPHAVSLNDTSFRNRTLKVTAKRKNLPGFSHRGRGAIRGAHRSFLSRGGRGGFRGRGRGRGSTGYTPRYRGKYFANPY